MRWSRLLVVLVALPLLLAADDMKPPPGWKEFAPQNKAYVVWLPAGARPTESKSSINLRKSGQIRIFRMNAAPRGGPVYATSQLQLPPGFSAPSAKVRQDLFRDMFLEEVKGKLVEEKKVRLGTMAGREYLVKTPRGMARFRLLGTGVVVFRVIVVGTKEQLESKATETFFSSFRRTPKTGTPTPPGNK